MKIYVVGSSALYYWRNHYETAPIRKSSYPTPLSDCPQSSIELHSAYIQSELFGPHSIHLMVSSDRERFERKKYRYSVCSKLLPDSAFCELSANCCIASPELCLLESAQCLSSYRVLELCMELCGYYALNSNAPRGFLTRNNPLTSIERIQLFVNKMHGVQGIPILEDVLKHAANGSRSPMETRQYLLMCLPRKVGGYGIPRPKLNEQVMLTSKEKQLSGRSYLECDMLWPDKQVVVEYDGHDDHESRESRARDAVKRNILVSQGNTVFSVTGKQICSVSSFDSIVRDIARSINYRIRAFPKDWEIRRNRLRNELFKSMTSFERQRFI